MKRVYTFMLSLFLIGQLFAGGIVTNSNQSIQYLRMLARSASGEIDAVYYNPAGVMRMENGFHLSLSNQSVFQTRTLTTTANLPFQEYEGEVNAYLFPNFYAVYKKDQFAVSLGFGPNGGGGSAEFKQGLPSFKMMAEAGATSLPALMTNAGIPTTDYLTDVYFDGSSVYYGTQLNFTYKINDMISLGAGVRMINAMNAYKGHVKIMTNPMHPLNPVGAGELTSTPAFFDILAGAAQGAVDNTQALIDGGAGNSTLDQLVGDGLLTQDEADQLSGGLGASYNATMDINAINGAYQQSVTTLSTYSQMTANTLVNTKQSGLAFTPIFSANITPVENLNISIKYELNTNLELTNDTKTDDTGMFPDDSTFRADIPAILAIGVEYGFTEKFKAQLSYVTYFDKNADWGGREDLIDKNLFELAFGIEYQVNDKILVSSGYSLGQAGPMDEYQTELSYTNSSHTVGLGAQYKPTEQLTIDVGLMNTIYIDHKVDYPIGGPTTAYSTTYGKKTIGFGIGATYKF